MWNLGYLGELLYHLTMGIFQVVKFRIFRGIAAPLTNNSKKNMVVWHFPHYELQMIPIHYMKSVDVSDGFFSHQATTHCCKSVVNHIHTHICIQLHIYICIHILCMYIHINSPCLSLKKPLKKPLRPVFARKFWSRRCGSSWIIGAGKKVILCLSNCIYTWLLDNGDETHLEQFFQQYGTSMVIQQSVPTILAIQQNQKLRTWCRDALEMRGKDILPQLTGSDGPNTSKHYYYS